MTEPRFWENEDGDYWVSAVDEPDRDAAGQYVANLMGESVDTGLTEPSVVRVQDCECIPTGDDCMDNPGTPCHTEDHSCWHFEGLGWWGGGTATDGRRVYSPADPS